MNLKLTKEVIISLYLTYFNRAGFFNLPNKNLVWYLTAKGQKTISIKRVVGTKTKYRFKFTGKRNE